MKILLFVFALWTSMYIDPSDGKKRSWTKIDVGNLKPGSLKYKLTCEPKCHKLKGIKVLFDKGGQIDVIGSILKGKNSSHTPFCKGETDNDEKEICRMNKGSVKYKDYEREEIYITLLAREKSSNVTLYFIMKGFKKAEPIKSHRPNGKKRSWTQIDIGHLKPGSLKYKLTCEGKCRKLKGMKVLFNKGGQLNVIGSIRKRKNSPYTPFCKGETDNDKMETCHMNKGSVKYQDYEREEIYITLLVRKKSSNVRLRFNMKGFKKAEPVKSNGADGKKPSWTVINIGHLNPGSLRYKLTCKKKCRKLKSMMVKFTKGGEIDVYGGILKTGTTSYSPFCIGESDNDEMEICRMNKGHVKYKDYEREEIYITLIAHRKSYNVQLRFTMIGFTKGAPIPKSG